MKSQTLTIYCKTQLKLNLKSIGFLINLHGMAGFHNLVQSKELSTQLKILLVIYPSFIS